VMQWSLAYSRSKPAVVMVPTPTLLELQVTWLVTSNEAVTPEVAMAMN